MTALQYKQDGNAAFKAKDFKVAIRNYHKALLYVRGIDQHAVKLPQMIASLQQQREREARQRELTEELTELVDNLRVDICNNLAASLLQSERAPFSLQKVLDYCDEAIELRPTNRKSWFRRGQAYSRAGEHEKAEQSLTKARDLLPERDPAIERLLASCRAQLKQQYQKEQSMYTAMFGGPSKPASKGAAQPVTGSAQPAGDGAAQPAGDAAMQSAAAPAAGACGDAPDVTDLCLD